MASGGVEPPRFFSFSFPLLRKHQPPTLRRFFLRSTSFVSFPSSNAVRRPPFLRALRGPLLEPPLREHRPRLGRRSCVSPRRRVPPRGRLVPRALRGKRSFFFAKGGRRRRKKNKPGADRSRIESSTLGEPKRANLDRIPAPLDSRRRNACPGAERGTRDAQLGCRKVAKKREFFFLSSEPLSLSFIAVAEQASHARRFL